MADAASTSQAPAQNPQDEALAKKLLDELKASGVDPNTLQPGGGVPTTATSSPAQSQIAPSSNPSQPPVVPTTMATPVSSASAGGETSSSPSATSMVSSASLLPTGNPIDWDPTIEASVLRSINEAHQKVSMQVDETLLSEIETGAFWIIGINKRTVATIILLVIAIGVLVYIQYFR